MTIKEVGKKEKLTPPISKEPVHEHFISYEDAVVYESRWKDFKTNLDILLKWVGTQNNLPKEIKNASDEVKECVLINYERFDFKSNEPFRRALIKLIVDSDCMDIDFGMKSISKELHDIAEGQIPNSFADKKFISCVILTCKNYSNDGKGPCLTCTTTEVE